MSRKSYLENFFYLLQGPENGRKWVFLHGLMGYASNWRKVLSGMSEERTLAIDQRGHGRSFKPDFGYASEDYADDLQLITEELGWDSFILVGHSMGGRNALAFAHKYPQKVQKLVIEDIGPEPQFEAIEYYQKMLNSVPTPFPSRLEAKEFFLNVWPTLGVVHDNVMALGQYLNSNLEEKEDGRVDWRFSRAAILASVTQGRAKDVWHELRGLTMPTLVIRGQNSRELSPEVFQRMILANPNIRGVEISNAGHWVHADQSQEFLRNILEFAKS